MWLSIGDVAGTKLGYFTLSVFRRTLVQIKIISIKEAITIKLKEYVYALLSKISETISFEKNNVTKQKMTLEIKRKLKQVKKINFCFFKNSESKYHLFKAI